MDQRLNWPQDSMKIIAARIPVNLKWIMSGGIRWNCFSFVNKCKPMQESQIDLIAISGQAPNRARNKLSRKRLY
jgi:hypothetical protein